LDWDSIAYVLLNKAPDHRFDEWLSGWTQKAKVLLGAGVTADNVTALLEGHTGLHGLALDGASEEKVGVNDFDLVDSILEKIDQ
jgi:copper homeostasis protein CutC